MYTSCLAGYGYAPDAILSQHDLNQAESGLGALDFDDPDLEYLRANPEKALLAAVYALDLAPYCVDLVGPVELDPPPALVEWEDLPF